MITVILFIVTITFILRRVCELIVEEHEAPLKDIVILSVLVLMTPILFIYDFVVSTYLLLKHFKWSVFKAMVGSEMDIKTSEKIANYTKTARKSPVNGVYLVLILKKIARVKYDTEKSLFESFVR